jgi:hypothetical protein
MTGILLSDTMAYISRSASFHRSQMWRMALNQTPKEKTPLLPTTSLHQPRDTHRRVSPSYTIIRDQRMRIDRENFIQDVNPETI